jgi:hypothetical protein
VIYPGWPCRSGALNVPAVTARMPGGWCPSTRRLVTPKSSCVHLLFPYFSLTVPRHLTRGYRRHARLVWVSRFACPAWGRGGLVLIATKEWWGI